MRPSSNNKQFFFVNNSESSIRLSKCPPQEKAAVQSYVQTGRKRPRNARRAEVTSRRFSSPRRFPETSATNISRRASSNSDRAGERGSAVTLGKHSSNLDTVHNGVLPDVPLVLAPLTYQTILSKRDPFNAASVPIDQSVAGLLHYYMYHYHPSLWPNELVLLRHGVYTFPDSVLDLMKTAIANKLTMYCLLSASVCRLRFVDRLPSSLPTGIENNYIREALRLMKSYVATVNLQEENTIKQCLICMIYLSSAESYRGDLSAAKAHLVPAARLLEPLGGLTYVKDDNLKGQLAMADLALASVELQPCLFDCSYNPGPACTLKLTAGELHVSYATSTAASLLTVPDSFIPLDLKALIKELVESHSVKSRILTSSMPPERAIEVTHWISLRNMAIRNRLLAWRTTDPRMHALRVSMIMWSLLFNISGRIKTVKMMAPTLRSILVDIPANRWQHSADIRLWISLLGLYCAKEGSEESAWFMNECSRLYSASNLLATSRLGSTDMVDKLESFQLKFFYDIPIQNSQTRILSEKLQLSFPRHLPQNHLAEDEFRIQGTLHQLGD